MLKYICIFRRRRHSTAIILERMEKMLTFYLQAAEINQIHHFVSSYLKFKCKRIKYGNKSRCRRGLPSTKSWSGGNMHFSFYLSLSLTLYDIIMNFRNTKQLLTCINSSQFVMCVMLLLLWLRLLFVVTWVECVNGSKCCVFMKFHRFIFISRRWKKNTHA